MKKSFAALLLLAGMAAFLSAPAFAYDETMSGDIANKLVNAQELQERRAGTKLRVSGTTDDTVYVGHSTAGAAQAPWYIYTGPYLPDQNDPSIAGNQDGYWGWDNFNAGLNDSLMGWWVEHPEQTADDMVERVTRLVGALFAPTSVPAR